MGLTEDEILAIRLEGINDGVQQAAQKLLEAAERARATCRCSAMSFPEVASLLEAIAYRLDAEMVMRAGNIDASAKADGVKDPRLIAAMKRAAKQANKGRRYMVKKASKWRKVLGFEEGYKPTEEEVIKAYKDKAKETHPDRPDTDSPEAFQKVQAAKDKAMEELHGPKLDIPVQSAGSGPAQPEASSCATCGGNKHRA